MSLPPMPTLSMSHVGLYVHDMDTMLDFYTRVMGFTETDRGLVRGAQIVFTSADPRDHHQVALIAGRPERLDLALPAEEIRTRSEVFCRTALGFRSAADFRAELAAKMGKPAP